MIVDGRGRSPSATTSHPFAMHATTVPILAAGLCCVSTPASLPSRFARQEKPVRKRQVLDCPHEGQRGHSHEARVFTAAQTMMPVCTV